MPIFDFETEVEETRWTVEPIVPLGQLCIVLAQAGVGKSLFAESLAVHTVYEVPFCGFETKYGDVLIIDQDTPSEILNKRLVKFGKALGDKPKHNLFTESMKNFTLGDGTLFSVIKEHESCTLVVIDSLHSVCGRLNPNYTSDMNVLARLKRECLDTERTIIVNHHISEKLPYTTEQLMSGNSHMMAMGNSAIIQQADSYYIIGASANNGLTDRLYIRPVPKRVSIRSNAIILQIVQPSSGGERLEYDGDFTIEYTDEELDCLTLFREYPSDRTVKEVYDDMGHKHGEIAVRKALTGLNKKGVLLLSKHKSNLFRYRLP